MKKLFIIGGMGSGKSTVTHALEHLGLPTIDLDDIAHETLADADTIQALAAAFGPDVLNENASINRSVLAARAFADAERTHALNAITQPRILATYQRHLAALMRAGATVVVVEYPLFPQERDAYVSPDDLIVAVTAPLKDRIARAVAAGFDESDVRRRIANQASDEERARWADVTFINDGTPEALEAQVRDWWRGVAEGHS